MGLLDKVMGGLGGNLGGGLGQLLEQARSGQHDQIDPQAAWTGFHEAAGQLSTGQMKDAALQAFQKLSPELRTQVAQQLQQAAQQQGVSTPALDAPNLHEPGQLAAAAAQLHEQGGAGLLGQLLGGAGGVSGLLQNPAAKAALGLIAAAAITHLRKP